MKKIVGIIMVLAMVFVFAACGSTSNGDDKKSADSTSELLASRYAFEDGGFSIQPPKDWEAKDIGAKYLAFVDQSKTDFAPNINFVVEEYSGSLEDYTQANIKTLESIFKVMKIVSQSDFTTLGGLEGQKLVVNDEQAGTKLQQTFYLFELSKTKKIVVTCTNLEANAADTSALFEESASTFKVAK